MARRKAEKDEKDKKDQGAPKRRGRKIKEGAVDDAQRIQIDNMLAQVREHVDTVRNSALEPGQSGKVTFDVNIKCVQDDDGTLRHEITPRTKLHIPTIRIKPETISVIIRKGYIGEIKVDQPLFASLPEHVVPVPEPVEPVTTEAREPGSDDDKEELEGKGMDPLDEMDGKIDKEDPAEEQDHGRERVEPAKGRRRGRRQDPKTVHAGAH